MITCYSTSISTETTELDFAHAQERAFRAKAVRNRLLAEWVAARTSLTSDAAEHYISSIFNEDILLTDNAHLVSKVVSDIARAGTPVTENDVWFSLRQFAAQVHKDIVERDL